MKKTIMSIFLVLMLALSMFGNVNLVKDVNADIEGIILSNPTYTPEKIILGLGDEKVDVKTTVTNNNEDIVTLSIRATAPTDNDGNALIVENVVEDDDYENGESIDVVFTIITRDDTVAGSYEGKIIATETVEDGDDNIIEKTYTINVEDLTPRLSMSGLNDDEEIVITGEEEEKILKTFSLKNVGNVDLDNLQITFSGDFSDGEETIDFRIKFNEGVFNNLEITQDVNPITLIPVDLAVDDILTITLEADIQDGIDLDTYTGDFIVKDTDYEAQTTLSGDILVRIEPSICDEGRRSSGEKLERSQLKLKLNKINNPDKGEKFNIGDEIEIDVEVENKENKELEVVVEAILYDLDEGDDLETVESESRDLKDEKDDFDDLVLTIPNDEEINPEHTYILYMKTYDDGNEENYCDFEGVEIEIDRENDDVIVNDFVINPSIASQGDIISFTVEAENIGTKKQKDVYIKLRDRDNELGLDLISDVFELDEYDDNDKDIVKTFTFTIPSDAVAKEYWIEAIVYDKKGKQYDENTKSKVLEKLTIQGEPTPETPETPSDNTGDLDQNVGTGAGTYQPVTGSSIFENLGSTKTLFIIGDIVLVILAVLFLVLIFRRR